MYVVPSINISLMLSQVVHCVHDESLTHIWLLERHQKLLCYAFMVKVMFIVSTERPQLNVKHIEKDSYIDIK